MQPENRMSVGMKGFWGKKFPVRAKKKSAEKGVWLQKNIPKNERQPAGILTIFAVIQAKNRTVFLKNVP